MTQKVLALYLDAPLQSWGYQSRFDRRTSLSFPTRSGILGMICAALGIDWDDHRELERLDKNLVLTTYTLGAISMVVDYHTVGGGFDKNTHTQNIVTKADGKSGATVVTYREYLQDSRFGVLLRGDVTILEEILNGLHNPKWGVWLGRKSCIPTSPIAQGIFASEEEALTCLEARARSKATRCVSEVNSFDQGSDTLLDRPVNFKTRQFKPRRIDNEAL